MHRLLVGSFTTRIQHRRFLTNDLFETGAHLLPNSIAMSTGSVFAGWMMHKTGKYKLLNLIFGFFPFIGATAICLINENSGFIQSWFSIV